MDDKAYGGVMARLPPHCAGLVRAGDRDRYVAALLASEPAQTHLLALQAFDLELRQIGDRVNEPLVGEIRLQWWRDQLAAMIHGAPGDHPILEALQPAIAFGRLPMSALNATIDARAFDIYPELPPDLNVLDGYLGETFGAIIQLSCLLLGEGRDEGSGAAAGHAGVAIGLAWVLRNLPHHAARGRLYLPEALLMQHGADPDALLRGEGGRELDAALAQLRALARHHLAEARAAVARLPVYLRPAFAPLALVAPALRCMERPGFDPLHDTVRLSPLARQWRIWRAVRAGL